mgnify:FL=1
MNLLKKINNEERSNKNSNFINVARGSIMAITITLVCLVIFSVILANTEVAESAINPVIILVTAVSIFVGSIMSVSRISKRGIINGGIVGMIYFLAIYILSGIVNSNFSINISGIILIICGILAGMLGGIVGVNIKKWKK